jgi:DNA helicase-2/ATP-dependent DNA helicase PcrA
MKEELSAYQIAVVKDIDRGHGNTGINAVAGSGKTFIICHGARQIPKLYNVLMSAFGNDIAKELRTRDLPRNCNIATYNGLGWGIAQKHSKVDRLILQDNKTEQILQHMVLRAKEEDSSSWGYYLKTKAPIKRLVSLLKGRFVTSLYDVPATVEELIEHHALEVPDNRDFIEQVTATYRYSINNKLIYDFDDQIFQPLLQEMLIPAYDYVFVDEYQDTNKMQALLMEQACRGGRFFGVGDPDQAIYGFRGSTPGAYQKFLEEMNAKELPLSICYRCPKRVIAEAQKIVPRIEAAPWAREGQVDEVSTDFFLKTASPGDFVICRTVAPLIKRCLQNIRDGVPAYVFGRDLGSDLEYLIEKVCQGGYFMPITSFRDHLNAYVMQKMISYERLGQENLALGLEDKHLTLLAFMEGCECVSDVMQRIRATISDEKVENKIRYMTIHKSKGLECKFNVWALRPDLLPHPRAKKQWMLEEERRLKYVLITRATNGFFYVRKESNEK